MGSARRNKHVPRPALSGGRVRALWPRSPVLVWIAPLLLCITSPALRAPSAASDDPTRTPSAETFNAEAEGTTADSAPSPEALRSRLDELQDQLEREREALAEQRERQQTEIDRKRKRRGELARKLLDAEAERQDLEEEAESLRKTEQQVRDEVEALESAAQRIRTAARAAAEQLGIHLRELPGRADWQQQADRLRQRLSARDGGNDTNPSGEAGTEVDPGTNENPDADGSDPDAADLSAVGPLAELLERVHADGARLSVRETEVWTMDGRKRQVELLSVGHVAFAYRTLDTPQQLAVTLASPADASGYRWSEDLTPSVRRALRAAFDRAGAEGSAASESPVAVPMDVTGRLRAEALSSEQDLRQTLQSGGPVMLPLAAIIAMALALILERVWQLYGRNGAGGRLAASVVDLARAGRFEEAERRCRPGRSTQARVLAACLARREAGQHAMEDAIQEQLMHESPRLERFLGGLAVLAAIAPLLGLLGTVTGIIETFGVIRSFGNTSPSLMAGGISEALVTTATGLSIAIPILLIHSVLRGRAGRITAEAEKHAATLLNVLAHPDRPADPADTEADMADPAEGRARR